MRRLSGLRKAYASRGDDMRARFVRVSEDDRGPRKRRQNRPRLPGFESPFIQEGRTKFSKSVQAPTKDILVSGYNNIKIGKVVTARKPVYPGGFGIGDAIQEMNAVFFGRSMIRFSDGGMADMSTVSIGNPDSCPKDAFICPEQTGKSVGCDACGACWGTRKNVAFLEH